MTAHAIARAAERYGLALCAADIAAIAADVAAGRAVLLQRGLGGRRGYWLVMVRQTALIAIVAASTGAVLTVLPRSQNFVKLRRLRGQKDCRRSGKWDRRGRPERDLVDPADPVDPVDHEEDFA